MKRDTPQEIKDMDNALKYLKRLPENELRYIVARINQDLIPRAINNKAPGVKGNTPGANPAVVEQSGVSTV